MAEEKVNLEAIFLEVHGYNSRTGVINLNSMRGKYKYKTGYWPDEQILRKLAKYADGGKENIDLAVNAVVATTKETLPEKHVKSKAGDDRIYNLLSSIDKTLKNIEKLLSKGEENE